MYRPRIGLLSKKRGNFALQEKYAGQGRVADTTSAEVEHHRQSLEEAGYAVRVIPWGPSIIQQLMETEVDLVFNVSSLVEAAILEELGVPYVGSNSFTISLATDKSLAKRMWQHAGLPTSLFIVAHRPADCEPFRDAPPFPYPLFIKPVAGRGSAGIDDHSVVWDYQQLVNGVSRRLRAIGQPVLVERFLRGREITIGIVGNGQGARALPMLEIRYAGDDVTLTFDKKERDDDLFLCPAPLDVEQAEGMRQLAIRAYQTLGFSDYGRIDTILSEEGPFLLEGNTFAGLMCTPEEKPHSYIGIMARAEAKGGRELLDEIIRAAMTRLGMGDEPHDLSTP
jgi:D-alanine-D-alanine ligase